MYGDDPKQTKFMKIGLEFIDNLAKIASALPFYRLFPTKLYKKYVSIVEEMHHIGEFWYIFSQINNSYITLTEVHELHGQMHPN